MRVPPRTSPPPSHARCSRGTDYSLFVFPSRCSSFVPRPDPTAGHLPQQNDLAHDFGHQGHLLAAGAQAGTLMVGWLGPLIHPVPW